MKKRTAGTFPWLLLAALVCLPSGLSGQGPESVPLRPRSSVEATQRFALLPPSSTGLTFAYSWAPPEKYDHELVNAVTGGGVCMGDYDGDGRVDVFLTQPFEGNRLYRNLGDWKFQDVTHSAGLTKASHWGTGASFADIDNDGDLDLFVCGYDCPNRLYVNQGDGTFVERAAEAGLAYHGASIMIAFADYDNDGDLDAYLCNNHVAKKEAPLWKYEKDALGRPIVPDELKGVAKPLYRPDIQDGKLIPAGESDVLYQNNGDGTFTDVSRQSGIGDEDFGLSATWWDFDHDGDADLYNANDFYGADHLYRNNGDGTFTNVNQFALPHTPWFSMGSDVADVNNDGWLDFMASDMQGSTHYKAKVSMGDMQGWFLETAIPRQYMRNALYINTGMLRFREAAFLAGVSATDWTWSLKFADLDSDGRQDLFVTNGAERFWDHSDMMKAARGAQRINTPELKAVWLPSPVRKDRNMAFRNRGDLDFEDVGEAWGLNAAQVSYGAALGDLDGDGDLDLVTNNFDEPAALYRNDSHEHQRAMVHLRGSESHGQGLGALLRITTGDGLRQTLYHTLSRGFMSANDEGIAIGLGGADSFDLTIEWPSGTTQTLQNLKADHRHTIREPRPTPKPSAPDHQALFTLSPALKDAKRAEAPFDDFAREPLLPNRLSQLGPGMAWGDINGDGVEELFIGAPAGHSGQLYQITSSGFRLLRSPAIAADAASEDMAPLFLDVDGDDDLDLYVVSGGVEHPQGSPLLQDRLYLNDGKGDFQAAPAGALPPLHFSGSVATASDFDRDGDLDLFVGARIIPGKYPEAPPSVLLRNEGGQFSVATEFPEAGLVTGALWSDLNQDGWPDLVLAREWGTVSLRINTSGTLGGSRDIAPKGWWNALTGSDVDHDGDLDLVAMNFGLNTKYHASPNKPATLYYGDMDGSGVKHLIEAKMGKEGALPVRGKSCSQGAMPGIRDRFPTFESFASATLTEIYTPQRLQRAEVYEAHELRSGTLLNDGQGNFTFLPLPRIAQIAPGFGCALTEIDGDGHPDLYIAQNFFGPQPETGRMNGGVSQLLLGRGDGQFVPVPPHESGLLVPGDATSLTTIDLNQDAWSDFIVASNDGPAFTFLRSPVRGSEPNRPLALRIRGPQGNPTAIGARLTLVLQKGQPQTQEITGGHGYLSQSSSMRFFGIPAGDRPQSLDIRWPDGDSTRIDLAAQSGRRLQISHPSRRQ